MVYQNNGIDNPVTGSYEEGMESLKHQEHRIFSNDGYYMRLVREAAHYYADMEPLRKKWSRANDFFMGRQLNDKIVHNGRTMTVEQLLKLKGLPIFQNDIISDKVLTMKGVLRQESMAATCKSTDSNEDMFAALFSEFLRKNDGINERQEYNSEQFLRHLVYAFICGKVSYTYRDGREDVFLDKPDIYKLSLPPFEKSDLSDVSFICEAHDMLWPELLKQFGVDKNGNASRKAEEELKGIYAQMGDNLHGLRPTGMNQRSSGDDYYHSTVVGKYRVLEIWKKERNRSLWCHDYATAEVGFRPLREKAEIDAENARRLSDNIMKDENGLPILDENGQERYYIDPDEVQLIDYKVKIEEFWYYRFLSPNGYLLAEGVSPYRVLRNGYGERFHPYVFLAYPCLEGETRSFVDRCIDKQRATNHYMIMFDSILGNSLKAVAIDEEAEGKHQTLEEMIDQSSRPNGVIIYNSSKGNPPQALQGNNIPSGLEWMIAQNQGMVTSQSGVQGALQGVHYNTSGKQYQAEVAQASTTVADYFGAFYAFCIRISKKQLWLMQQFYDSNRSVKVSGEDVRQYWNDVTMEDVNFDLQMDMDAYSAVMRQANNDMLWQLMVSDKIDLPTMLDCGYWTNTAKLKKRYEAYQQARMEAAAQTGMLPQGGSQQGYLPSPVSGAQANGAGVAGNPTVGMGGVSG